MDDLFATEMPSEKSPYRSRSICLDSEQNLMPSDWTAALLPTARVTDARLTLSAKCIVLVESEFC